MPHQDPILMESEGRTEKGFELQIQVELQCMSIAHHGQMDINFKSPNKYLQIFQQ